MKTEARGVNLLLSRRGHRRQPHGVRHHNEERLRGSRSERHADIGHRAVRGRRLLAPPANGGGHRGLSRTLPSRLEWTERYQHLLRTSTGWMCGMLQFICFQIST